MLCQLYTKLPPIRDDYKKVMFIKSDTEIIGRGNFYNLKTKEFIFRSFKSAAFHGEVRTKAYDPDVAGIKVKELPNILQSSYDKFPRKWLIQRDDGKPYADLKPRIKKIFGVGINPLRHAYITWFFKNVDYTLTLLKMEANRMHNTPDIFATYRYYGDKDFKIKDYRDLYDDIDKLGEEEVAKRLRSSGELKQYDEDAKEKKAAPPKKKKKKKKGG